jgi:hypothetical protein
MRENGDRDKARDSCWRSVESGSTERRGAKALAALCRAWAGFEISPAIPTSARFASLVNSSALRSIVLATSKSNAPLDDGDMGSTSALFDDAATASVRYRS